MWKFHEFIQTAANQHLKHKLHRTDFQVGCSVSTVLKRDILIGLHSLRHNRTKASAKSHLKMWLKLYHISARTHIPCLSVPGQSQGRKLFSGRSRGRRGWVKGWFGKTCRAQNKVKKTKINNELLFIHETRIRKLICQILERLLFSFLRWRWKCIPVKLRSSPSRHYNQKKVLRIQKLPNSHCDLSHSFPSGQESLVCLLPNLFAYYSRQRYPGYNSLKRRSGWLEMKQKLDESRTLLTCRTPLRISAMKKKTRQRMTFKGLATRPILMVDLKTVRKWKSPGSSSGFAS